MTKEQRLEIEKVLKPNQIALDTQTRKTGTDPITGFPTFEIILENAPQQYKVIEHIEPYNGAIVEVLSNENNTTSN